MADAAPVAVAGLVSLDGAPLWGLHCGAVGGMGGSTGVVSALETVRDGSDHGALFLGERAADSRAARAWVSAPGRMFGAITDNHRPHSMKIRSTKFSASGRHVTADLLLLPGGRVLVHNLNPRLAAVLRTLNIADARLLRSQVRRRRGKLPT